MSSKALFRAFAVLMVLAPTAVQAQVTTLAEAARATATTGTATSVSGIVTLPGGMSGDGLIVRLRDAVTGEVVGTTVTNVSGEFSFGELEVGDFIIEIIDQNGVILSVSSVLAMSPGQAVAALVRIPPPAPLLNNVLANAMGGAGAGPVASTAATVLGTASTSGVTGITGFAGGSNPPISPER